MGDVSINSTSTNRRFPLIPLLRIEATESKRDQLIRLGLFPLIPLLRIEATWGDDQSTEELLNLGFH